MLDWTQCSSIESIPGKVSGAWVFRGTRVPVSAVLKNLKELSLDEVLEEYPSVSRQQVLVLLDFLAEAADPLMPQQKVTGLHAGSPR